MPPNQPSSQPQKQAVPPEQAAETHSGNFDGLNPSTHGEVACVEPERGAAVLSPMMGVLLGITAAVTYSITNLALRQLATGDGGLPWDLWISATKAMPTALISGLLLLRRRGLGQPVFPEWSLLWKMILAGLLMQFGGNVGFQLSLRAIGLAISVPIVFASVICCGAVMGRAVLGDQVSKRTAISMALMVVSIVFLSAAAHGTAEPVVPVSDRGAESEADANTAAVSGDTETKSMPYSFGVTLGVIIALVSGLSYGMCGVIIRRVVRGQMPVETTLFLFSMTGVVALGPVSFLQLGLPKMQSISTSDWSMMLISGVFNSIGFFAITHAYRVLTISRANVINASQNAICAIGAVLFFAEPLSGLAAAGIGLTILGLIILDRK
jgi:drug/metabolite transporter (DMT)-like permease